MPITTARGGRRFKVRAISPLASFGSSVVGGVALELLSSPKRNVRAQHHDARAGSLTSSGVSMSGLPSAASTPWRNCTPSAYGSDGSLLTQRDPDTTYTPSLERRPRLLVVGERGAHPVEQRRGRGERAHEAAVEREQPRVDAAHDA